MFVNRHTKALTTEQTVARRMKQVLGNHKMTIELDQGLHRSIKFSNPSSNAYHFRLVTWPGYLAISGDCEDYIFRRDPDMFEFFRYAGPSYDKTERTSLDYWAEKCTATGKNGKIEVFSEDLYTAAIRDDMAQYLRTHDRAATACILRSAHEERLFDAMDTLAESIEAAISFKCPISGDRPFADFWDHNLEEISYHFTWSASCIQWGIKQYDLAMQGRTQSDHDRKVLAGLI